MIMDLLFRNAIVFLLVYAWVMFYLSDWVLAVIIAALSSLLICLALDKISGARKAKKKLTTKEQEQCENITLQLLFSTETDLIEYFRRLLACTHEPKIVAGAITYTEKAQATAETYAKTKKPTTSKLNLAKKTVKATSDTMTSSEKVVFIPCYGNPVLTHAELATAIKKAKQKKADSLIIACPACSPELGKLANMATNPNITILNQAQIYNIYVKPNNLLPKEALHLRGKVKLGFKDLLNHAFSGKRTKSFVWLGLILILSSFFVAFKLYYLVMGSTLLVFAIISHINGQKRIRSA